MREKAISAYGCDIVRIEGNYDDSVRHADKDAQNNGWYVVSDTSYEGIEKSQVLSCKDTQLSPRKSLNKFQVCTQRIFLPGGVGGIAAAVSSEISRI